MLLRPVVLVLLLLLLGIWRTEVGVFCGIRALPTHSPLLAPRGVQQKLKAGMKFS